MIIKRFASVCSFVVMLCPLAASTVCGEVVTYTIDPTQSSLSVLGSLNGNPAGAQTAGSLSTSFSGTIVADRTPTTIAFNGGSVLNAALQASNQQPNSSAIPDTNGPADYGRTADGPFGTTIFEALRGVLLDIEDDTSGAGIPIVGTQFNSLSMIILFDAGSSDLNYGNSTLETELAGLGNSNSGGQPSMIEVLGSTEKLTLRISSGPVFYTVQQTNDSDVSFVGEIVATRTVPEPGGAVALLGIGLFGSRLRRRRV